MILSNSYLRSHFPLLNGKQLCDDIIASASLVSIPAKETLLRNEQYIDYIPLVAKGAVKVLRQSSKGSSIFLYFIRSGQTCTMTLSSCIRRETSRVIARTIIDSELLLIPVERVYYYTRHYPSWNNFATAAYQEKFDTILDRYESLAFDSLTERTINYLSELAFLTNTAQIQLSHAALAMELGTSRVGISRILKKLEQEEKIELGRKCIEVL